MRECDSLVWLVEMILSDEDVTIIFLNSQIQSIDYVLRAIIILDYKLNFTPEASSDELHARVSSRMAKTCIRNAGLYIKLGQSLAIQAAVLPAPYKLAFESMFDASTPIPFKDVRRVWDEEFDEALEDVFDEFDQTPIACGSIAQVHAARLKHTGQRVAVKVQRPDIPIQLEL